MFRPKESPDRLGLWSFEDWMDGDHGHAFVHRTQPGYTAAWREWGAADEALIAVHKHIDPALRRFLRLVDG
jgi:hypothetical protein